MQKPSGKFYPKGVSPMDLFAMFPDEETSAIWLESVVWGDGRRCGKCGGLRTKPVPNKSPMPYWCPDCRSYFSVRTGTAVERSKVPLQKWCIAIHLCLTSSGSVSSMKLHRDIKVSQPTAWFMLNQIRGAWGQDFAGNLSKSVAVDVDAGPVMPISCGHMIQG